MSTDPARALRQTLLAPLRSIDASAPDAEVEARFDLELERARERASPGSTFLPALVLVTLGRHELLPEVAAAMPPPHTALARVANGLRHVLPLPDDLAPATEPDRLAAWYAANASRLRWSAATGRFVLVGA